MNSAAAGTEIIVRCSSANGELSKFIVMADGSEIKNAGQLLTWAIKAFRRDKVVKLPNDPLSSFRLLQTRIIDHLGTQQVVFQCLHSQQLLKSNGPFILYNVRWCAPGERPAWSDDGFVVSDEDSAME